MRYDTPEVCAIHESRSARMLNNFGADHRPKGMQ